MIVFIANLRLCCDLIRLIMDLSIKAPGQIGAQPKKDFEQGNIELTKLTWNKSVNECFVENLQSYSRSNHVDILYFILFYIFIKFIIKYIFKIILPKVRGHCLHRH